MEGRHQEDTTAFAVLLLGVTEPRDLDHHAEVFDEENPAQHGDQQLLADGDGERGNDAAERKRSGVAHEDLRGERVVPQERNASPHKRRDEHHEFLGARDVHDAEVIRDDGVGADVRKDGERHADDGAGACGQAVNPVREVGAVADCGDNEDDERDEHDPHVLCGIFHQPRQQPSVVKVVVLDERDGCGGGSYGGPSAIIGQFLDGDVRVPNHGGAQNQSHPHLSQDFESACESFLVFLKDFDIVVDETNGPEPNRAEDHQLGIDVGEIREQEGGDEDGAKNDQATHGRCALLVHLAFKPQVSNNFTYLFELQLFNDSPSKEDSNESEVSKLIPARKETKSNRPEPGRSNCSLRYVNR